ncbi:hypothetical protein [Fulvivirga sp.]|uniref:tetratricopeptide repeat protein n=1 Tax=Fulvivirga sp. TaxID=1931237 RepID=UPI0032EC29E6
MRFLFVFFMLVACHASSFSQHLYQNLPFFNYLINTRNYEEAGLLLNTLEDADHLSIDSINYYKGKVFYLSQNLSEATVSFNKLSNPNHPLFIQGSFYNAFCKSHLGEYQSAMHDLQQLTLSDSLIVNLRALQLAGIYLLDRNLHAFDDISSTFNHKYYQTSSQEKSFLGIRNDLGNYKRKSPFLAGVLSAAIPGMGRIYAGKTGLGIGTLLTSAVFALQTWESYRKDGVKSARFIIFGSIFSIFYVGNIWGSVFTVKISNAEFNDAVNHKILVDMHIPLRSIFN